MWINESRTVEVNLVGRSRDGFVTSNLEGKRFITQLLLYQLCHSLAYLSIPPAVAARLWCMRLVSCTIAALKFRSCEGPRTDHPHILLVLEQR